MVILYSYIYKLLIKRLNIVNYTWYKKGEVKMGLKIFHTGDLHIGMSTVKNFLVLFRLNVVISTIYLKNLPTSPFSGILSVKIPIF